MNNLQKYRKETGLSQAKFAKEMGWKQSRIGNYEARVRTPTLFNAKAIVRKLNELGVNCSLDDIFPSVQN
ncbi:TPA: helix-turn-helix transcriptional regulator [Pasteurella multocida]|uniref:XRE family transcriptional regulator n=2 Tax=Pasteurella TaxID=745 RepID=A0A1D2NX39_PASMD|nr:helix-turn-helix transcriptional regulator [Pasteurella multocida]EGP02841.1 helix-turn-helix domain-containing protein [Pasteurella multocida subsp. gallicida str. Anand1_poultry]AFI45231.1 HTH-type transcriptional regulator, putative [Pasteurella multocida subsp. multocida str. 3480]ANJ89309.1 helix-turn-helix domain-containing protein [Pasteurella multocida subsp. multocida HB01]ANJ90560.1 helix-turn-helix domain-containing protein [Pasteurella multocida subsp. multocida HB01]AON58467.1 